MSNTIHVVSHNVLLLSFQYIPLVYESQYIIILIAIEIAIKVTLK